MPKLEYAPAPESRAIVSLRESYGLFINGEFTPGVDGHAFKTISPATEEVLAEVTEAGPADVDRAVTAARKAYEHSWSAMPGRERAKYLFRIARIVQEKARELAVLESLDNGKPIRESRDVDIPLVAAHFFYYAGWADKLEYAGYGPVPRPIGVAGQVIPWNFPLLMLAWKIAPALACGNTVVLKPAETTPLTALAFAEICQQADLPPGVATLRLGDPLDKNTDVGAINSAAQLAKIRELSDVGEAEGAERWSPPCELPVKGFWFPPTIFTGVSQAHRIAREEIFGPVLSVLTFRTPAEAVEKANNTPYGLSAGVWTDKGSRILWMASRLRAGVVWSNTFNRFDPTSPFGGYKQPGFGRQGGVHGLEAYLDV